MPIKDKLKDNMNITIEITDILYLCYVEKLSV